MTRKKFSQNALALLAIVSISGARPSVAAPAAPMALMPMPTKVQVLEGSLLLQGTFLVSTDGETNPRLQAAISRMVRRIDDAANLRHAGVGVTPTTPLVVHISHSAAAVQSYEEDESYALTVSPERIRIDAPNELGAMHGLETLVQLVHPAGDHFEIPAVKIEDAPRFQWRGLLIDCSRHFEPLEVLKRNIDALAAVKMNVFHWHLTDDQGFRIESKLYPALTAKGSDGNFYTQEQARDIVAYAHARGVRVVPEFEMPGHSTAWLYAYPELSSGATPDHIRREFGISNYALDPTREETYAFIERFLKEMVTVFPDEYVHIGGDETPAPDWKTNPKIQTFMRGHNLKDNAALQAYFNSRILAILMKLNRRVIGWDEVMTPGLPKTVVVQSWRGVKSLSQGAKDGYTGILSAPYYLDAMHPAAMHYLADPIPAGSDMTEAERSRVIGGEATMWAEHVDAHDIDSRIWPRAAAVAERLWSPADRRDVASMYSRLWAVSLELETLGVRHLSAQDAGLRQLAHTQAIDALRAFARAFEPVSFSERSRVQRTDQLTPLDSFVDAVVPDPPARHWLESTMQRFLADPRHDTQDRDDLLAYFASIKQAVPPVLVMMAESPQLAVMRAQAEALTQVCDDSATTVHALADNRPTPAEWKQGALAHLASASDRQTMTRYVGAVPVKALFSALP